MGDGGYTPSQIRLFTLADVNELYDWWSFSPPLRVIAMGIGVALGLEPPKGQEKATAPSANPSAAQLRQQFPGGLMRG